MTPPTVEQIAFVYDGITKSGYKIVADMSQRPIGLTVEEVQALFYSTEQPDTEITPV